jgi:hypothetical protein
LIVEWNSPVVLMLALAAALLVLVVLSGRGHGGEIRRTCRACGAAHPEFARFCRRCGTKL